MSIRFDSNTDSLQKTSSGVSNSTYSACCHARLRVDTNNFQTLFTFDKAGSGQYNQLATDSDGTTMKLWANPSTSVSMTALTVDTWYFFGITKSGSTLTGYYATASGGAISSVTGSSASFGSATDIAWGKDVVNNNFGWNGAIANMKVWSGVALSSAEMDQERQSCLPVVQYASLKYFNPGFEAVGTDWSGNALNFTVGGSLAVEEAPPVPYAAFQPRIYIPPVVAVTAVSRRTLDPRVGSRGVPWSIGA